MAEMNTRTFLPCGAGERWSPSQWLGDIGLCRATGRSQRFNGRAACKKGEDRGQACCLLGRTTQQGAKSQGDTGGEAFWMTGDRGPPERWGLVWDASKAGGSGVPVGLERPVFRRRPGIGFGGGRIERLNMELVVLTFRRKRRGRWRLKVYRRSWRIPLRN